MRGNVTADRNHIQHARANNAEGVGVEDVVLSKALSEIGIQAVCVVHVAFRRADPGHFHLAA